jgi:hypothetical protein
LVEAVVLIPLVMFLILVAVQGALWMHASQVAQLAASEGDRVGRSFGGGAGAGVAQAQAILHSPGSNVSAPTVTAAVLPGDALVVRVSAHVPTIVPGLVLSVSSSANGTIQKFRGSE